MCKLDADKAMASAGQARRSRLTRFAAMAGGMLLTAMLVAGWGMPGHAAVPQDDPFAGLEVLGAAELAEKRGGFFDAVLGIHLNLAADIVTKINGAIELMTTITFTEAGLSAATHSLTVPAGFDLSTLTFLSSDGSEIAGVSTQNSTGPVLFSVPGGPQVTVPAGFQGLVAKSDSGIIAGVNKITKAQFANLVINANPADPGGADPLSQIQQELTIKIDVQNFSQLQQNVRFNASMAKFRDAMRSASLGALGAN